MMAMPCVLTKGIPKKKRGLNGQPIKEYRPVDGAAVAECKAMWRKIEEGTSITWEVFVAFLRIHRVAADGCTCANYCTFTMCEGVLMWLLVKEPNSKVPSQYYWEIIAQRPFKLGRIECKVTARAEPSRKVHTRQSQKLASQKKWHSQKAAGRWWPVVIPIATLMSPRWFRTHPVMVSLSLLLLPHPWRCIGGTGIALISFSHLMCVANVTRPCTCGACNVRGVAFAYTL